MSSSVQNYQKEILVLNRELKDFNYEILQLLGLGAFGRVFKGRNIRSSEFYAIKAYSKKDFKNNLQDTIYEEANLLRTLKHPNIVQFFSLHETNTHIFLIMELINGSNLKTLIEERKKEGKPFSEQELRDLFGGIIEAIRYLHQNEIVHRDIKPENILLSDNQDYKSVKIIDFGLSVRFLDTNKNLYLKCGTPLFIAPELKKYKVYSKPVDIWSCGVLFYELCTLGEHPFYNGNENSLNQENFQIVIPQSINPLVASLLEKMLVVEPSDRYNAENVASHCFLTEKTEFDMPLTPMEAMKAFQNQEKLLNLFKMVIFCSFVKKKSVKLERPQKKHISLVIEKKEKIFTSHLKIGGEIKLLSPNKEKTPLTMVKHYSSSNNCTDKGKNRWSPFNFNENEMNKTKSKNHLFSFNSTDVESDLQDLKKMMFDQKETEKNIMANQSLHIENIIEKGKHLKIHSALLRSSMDKKVPKINKEIASNNSEKTEESVENSFLKNINFNLATNDETVHFPVIKSRIKSCYSTSPKKK